MDCYNFNMELKDVTTLKGDNGASAYQIALDNGFKGTEQEWLDSLKGEKGEQGIQGIQGIQGDKGEQGISAYQVAQQQGFEGTEQEWLNSLKGQDGIDAQPYDDTAITNRVSALENTIGVLNDSLEAVLNGN